MQDGKGQTKTAISYLIWSIFSVILWSMPLIIPLIATATLRGQGIPYVEGFCAVLSSITPAEYVKASMTVKIGNLGVPFVVQSRAIVDAAARMRFNHLQPTGVMTKQFAHNAP